MKRKILIFILIIVILSSGFVVYLNKVLLPIKFKAILIKNIETTLNRRAELESIRFNIFKGIEMRGLTIYESPAFKDGIFLKIKEADIGFLFLPLLKEKKVIITHLKIDSPEFKLIRDKDNLWNFSDLLKIKLPEDKSKQKLSFLIYKIAILKARCQFEDRGVSPNLSKEIQDFNCRINFGLPSKLKFVFEGKIPNKKEPAYFSAKGEFDFAKLKLNSGGLIKSINLVDYKQYYKNLPFNLDSAEIDNANINVNWQDDFLEISSSILTKNIDLKQNTYEFKGSPIINADIGFSTKTNKNPAYSGETQLNGSNINGVPYLVSLQNLTGRIIFDNNKVNFPAVKASTAGTPLDISGAIENLANPLINLKISSDIEVAKLKEMFKEQLKDLDLIVSGKTHLELEINGLINANLTFSGTAKFDNLTAKTEVLPEQIKNISGEIDFDASGLKWKNLRGEFKGAKYVSSGSLDNFISPDIEVDLKSDQLFLSTKFNIKQDKISLDNLEGKFANSNFRVFGDMDILDSENPFCDLNLELNVDLNDLKNVLPEFKDNLEKIKPDGLIKLTGNFLGKTKDRQTWAARLNGQSVQVSLSGIKFNNLLFNYLLQETPADNLNISADCYGGKIAVLGKVDLRKEGLPFDLRAQADNLDLAKLKLDMPFKDKPTSGILSGIISLSGLAQNQESWQGRSSINFKDGNLWELNLFKGLGKFLLIPEFEKIAFKEANGEFSIADKNIHIDNLELKSNEMIIDAQGNVGFSGNLNLRLLAQFSEQFLSSSASLKKLFASILTTASQALTIKVTGTIQNPKYSVVPIVEDIIKSLPGIILDNILK